MLRFNDTQVAGERHGRFSGVLPQRRFPDAKETQAIPASASSIPVEFLHEGPGPHGNELLIVCDVQQERKFRTLCIQHYARKGCILDAFFFQDSPCYQKNFDRDAVKRVAIISFMDPVGTGSDLLSCRGLFSRSTPSVIRGRLAAAVDTGLKAIFYLA